MLFSDAHMTGGAERRRLFAMYEIVYAAVDFIAALCVVIGSICFPLKPTIRLMREIRLARMGKDDVFAERLKGQGRCC